jgi:hypothetical protein
MRQIVQKRGHCAESLSNMIGLNLLTGVRNLGNALCVPASLCAGNVNTVPRTYTRVRFYLWFISERLTQPQIMSSR